MVHLDARIFEKLLLGAKYRKVISTNVQEPATFFMELKY